VAAAARSALPAVGLLLVGVALLATSEGGGGVPLAFDAAFFPRLVIVAWIALALLVVLGAVRDGNDTAPVRFGSVLGMMLATGLFVGAMPFVGFFLAAAGFCMVALVMMGLRRPVLIGGYALGLPAALVVLFNHVLIMPLPTSPFTWLF
jgi:hypothetical protein